MMMEVPLGAAGMAWTVRVEESSWRVKIRSSKGGGRKCGLVRGFRGLGIEEGLL